MTDHNNHHCHNNSPHLHLSPSPIRQILPSFASHNTTGENFPIAKHHQKPRKKRTKLMRIAGDPVGSSSGTVAPAKPKYPKKPDQSAPKITRPCSECGKKFWSWKALFGHMRCHPERQWRGINPPPNFRRPETTEEGTTDEDHEIASCLLMLANSPTALETQGVAISTIHAHDHEPLEIEIVGRGGYFESEVPPSMMNCRFECSSCKKVFGSHQALGGHRASHKNVKGCFAITRCEGEEVGVGHNGGHVADDGHVDGEDKMVMVLGHHRCSICLRVFSSGQALGGHKRSHWEKGDEHEHEQSSLLNLSPFASREAAAAASGSGLDLNLPAPVEDDSLSSYSSSGLALDLRLGL